MTDPLQIDPRSHPSDASGTVEVWQGSGRLWHYRFLHPEGVVIRSNRSFTTRQESVDSAALAYPGVRIIELSEPPDAGTTPHPWRKLAIFSMITGGTGLIVVTVAKLLLFMRRLVKRGHKVMGWLNVAANLRRRDR